MIAGVILETNFIFICVEKMLPRKMMTIIEKGHA